MVDKSGRLAKARIVTDADWEGGATGVIFKAVSEGRPYPDHGLTLREWAQIPPRPVRLDQLVTTKRELGLDRLLAEDSTFYGDLFPHVVQWDGVLVPGRRPASGTAGGAAAAHHDSRPGPWTSPHRGRYRCGMTGRIAPLDLIGIDHLHSAEELEIRAVVRKFVDARLRPHVADWYFAGDLPARELALEMGKLGLLGMHLSGYGCAGVVGRRLRPGLPGAGGRRLGRAQPGQRAGLAGDVRDLEVRLGRAEGRVAAADGDRRGDRLLRPDRGRPRLRPGVDDHSRAPRRRRLDPAPAARCGSPTRRSPTSR